MVENPNLRLGTRQANGVLFAMVLGSGIAMLDGLVVNVALPRMDRDLRLGVAGAQWTVSGFLLSLSALLLLGGALGDQYGRRKIFSIGLVMFVSVSIVCGLAPNPTVLITARVLQGVGGALMVPASLAIIQSVFAVDQRGAAIGAWTGWGAVFTAGGPFVGGIFVTYVSWRWAFFINLPLGLLTLWATMKWVPETREGNDDQKVDFLGGALAVIGLGGVTYWGIEGTGNHASSATAFGIVGLIALVCFVLVEARAKSPMLPLSIFSSHQFNWVNVCTVIFYGAFVGGITFLGIQLQTGLGYSPLEAALATLPVSILLFFLSKPFGRWGYRVGAKYPMSIGPALVAVSLFLMGSIDNSTSYISYVLPVVLLWGVGLSITVAPLTAAAMAAVDRHHLGVGAAINNAASSTGRTLAISLLPAMAGIAASDGLSGADFAAGYQRLLYISAAFCLLAAVVALIFVEGRPQNASKATPIPD